MELVPTRSMGAINWRLGVGIDRQQAGFYAVRTCRSELARDPGVKLRRRTAPGLCWQAIACIRRGGAAPTIVWFLCFRGSAALGAIKL